MIDVSCEHCGRLFQVPRSLRSGFANCPDCGRATEIAGGPELLFWLLLISGVLVASVIVGVVYLGAGGLPALVVGAVFLVVILGAVLAS